jgi:hypothetical protein
MWLIRDLAAGAGGIVAMEIASYLDMLVRGRAASNQPQELGDALADRLEFAPGQTKAAKAKRSALGSLVGYVDGLALPAAATVLGLRRGSGARHAAMLTGGAMVGSSALPTYLGVTDPRTWTADDWVTDLVPHIAYGVTATLISRWA